jgi:hypothetical protein
MDMAHIDMVNRKLLWSYNIENPNKDYPCIFVLEKYLTGMYVRPIGVYNGTNFYEISEGYKQKVESGELQPWCNSNYISCQYMNWIDLDWWTNSRGWAFSKKIVKYLSG